MFQKINIILLLVFILFPISDAKSDTSSLHTADMIMPVDGTILRGFLDTPDGNNGIDIQVEIGTPVKAALDGTVVLVNTSDTNDNIILLRHKQNIYTVYSKLTNVTLAKDNIVKVGEKIGFVGSRSPSFLHFEVRHGTKPIDPIQFLRFQKTDEDVLNNLITKMRFLKTIKGVCSKLLVNGKVLPCKNSFIHTDYYDGRISFYILEEGGSSKTLNFSTGVCYFENPNVGEVNFKCVAADAIGMTFEGHFLTDVSEPEVKEFTTLINELLFKYSKLPHTEKLNLTKIKVKRCPDRMLSLPSGTICYGASGNSEGFENYGCFLRVIYESGQRGDILAVGKWTYYYNGKRAEGYNSESERQVGTWKYFDEEGELERTSFYKPENDELIYDCVLDE